MKTTLALFSLLLLLTAAVQAQAPRYELEPVGAAGFSDFGGAVAGVLDTNGDGFGDLLVGDVRGGRSFPYGSAGAAYLYDGATGALRFELASPQAQERGGFGQAVAGVPDTNGDGLADLLVGAAGEEGTRPSPAGRAYLFSGADGTLLQTIDSPNETFVGQFGVSVSGVPDADGDGFGDLLIGASTEEVLLADGTERQAGRAYLFSGATGALLHAWVSPNAESSGEFGIAVSGVDDADGDGLGDVLVGARDENPGGSPRGAGRAYVFSGASGGLLYELASPNEQRWSYFGATVSGVPDADGDGRGDLIVGAHRERTSGSRVPVGRAYVFSGADGTPLGAAVSPAEPDDTPYYYSAFARSVAGVPDVDGDGLGNLLVGASGEAAVGRAYLFDAAKPLPAVELTLIAETPVAIVDDGSFSFTALLRNTTDAVQTVEVWAELEREKDGLLFDPVFGPVEVTVGPGARVERTFVQETPEGTVPGDYTYRGLIGQFPSAPDDDDIFAGFVTALEGDRFYPLGLGDTWTYEVERGYCEYFTWDCTPFFRGQVERTVVADTLISGTPWSVAEVERRSLGGEVVDASRCAVRVTDDGRVVGRAIQGTCDTVERTIQRQGGTWNTRYPTKPDVAPAVVEIDDAFYDVDGTRTFQIDVDPRERYPKTSITAAADLGVTSYGMDSGGYSFYRWGRLVYAEVGGVIYDDGPALDNGRATAAQGFALAPAYPNPFRSAATLSFTAPADAYVRLTVYDVLGREVAVLLDGPQDAGTHTARFEGAGLPSGVYLVRLEADGQVQTQRITLVRS
ncbi:MAG: T9SS type A sorting domain-containing protein [Bacteroidota bacterium]